VAVAVALEESVTDVSIRVYRGGSWNSEAVYCRAAYRYWFSPSYRNVHLGFRPARRVVPNTLTSNEMKT
jgi:formylglycine-generating enzyme required for sulfatase activity